MRSPTVQGIVKSTDSYEEWMRLRTDISEKLLKQKHRKMSDGPFPFLRATFYRWVEQWHAVCPKLAERDDDVLLAVGDLHVENFGVWRDSRQRLVWGVNDFDDACELPFTSDLVRLTTSAMLAAAAAKIDADVGRLCAFVLEGYRAGLRTAGRPILVSGGRYPALVTLMKGTQENPRRFWKDKLDVDDNTAIDADDLPSGVEEMFRASFRPGARLTFRVQRSPGGLGSLGRRRYSAVEVSKGRAGGIGEAREAKALVPSALYWTSGSERLP